MMFTQNTRSKVRYVSLPSKNINQLDLDSFKLVMQTRCSISSVLVNRSIFFSKLQVPFLGGILEGQLGLFVRVFKEKRATNHFILLDGTRSTVIPRENQSVLLL